MPIDTDRWPNSPADWLTIGGVFTDPAEIERMQAAMHRRPSRPPRKKPRRYYPSLMAHRPD